MSQQSIGNTLSAMFLVAGTCIGGGMLALPLVTGVSGLFPSLFIMSLCALAMTISALLLLEVSLWMEEGVHVITMTSRILGVPGKVVSWVLYLFISYASIVAYTAGGGVQIAEFFSEFLQVPMVKDVGCTIFILLFGMIVVLGNILVGRVNTILFVSMIAAYVALLVTGLPEVKAHLLGYQKWRTSFVSVPILLTAFSFQTMVPSLTPYLKRNKKALRWAIVGGTVITYIVYALWQALILGIIPVEGAKGLGEALCQGTPPTQFLREHVSGWWVYYIAEYFAFFAIVTSFFGMTLGLYDFLSDGLKIEKTGLGQIYLAVLIVLPTLLFATQFERAFLVAMDLTGGIGDTIQNGMIPVLMYWIGHYVMKYPNSKPFPGGRVALTFIFMFFFISLMIELLMQSGCIFSYNDIIEIHNVQQVEQG